MLRARLMPRLSFSSPPVVSDPKLMDLVACSVLSPGDGPKPMYSFEKFVTLLLCVDVQARHENPPHFVPGPCRLTGRKVESSRAHNTENRTWRPHCSREAQIPGIKNRMPCLLPAQQTRCITTRARLAYPQLVSRLTTWPLSRRCRWGLASSVPGKHASRGVSWSWILPEHSEAMMLCED